MGNPQKNTYLQLIAAKRYIEELRNTIAALQYHIDYMKGFTMQQCLDVAQIANHLEFEHGPEEAARFKRRFKDTFLECADLCVEDGAADEEIVYTKDVMDRALREACGDDILPFDERYAEENLYFRDSRKEWKENEK